MYKSFLQILHTVQNTPEERFHHVEQLFVGHPDLIEEFKQFLPERLSESTNVRGVQINPIISQPSCNKNEFQQQERQKPKVSFQSALDFLDKVKVEYATSPEVYTEFLAIIERFLNNKSMLNKN